MGYNNTMCSATTPIHSEYTEALIKQQSTNCEKCGKYVEFHPERSADASIIFMCSNAKPCSHALCYDCGILYNLKTETNAKVDIVKALQGEVAEVGAESPEPAESVDGDDKEKNINIASVVPMAIMAEMMQLHP